ncbi:hypothetical protein ACJX0J_009603, partial [Zea mays]
MKMYIPRILVLFFPLCIIPYISIYVSLKIHKKICNSLTLSCLIFLLSYLLQQKIKGVPFGFPITTSIKSRYCADFLAILFSLFDSNESSFSGPFIILPSPT